VQPGLADAYAKGLLIRGGGYAVVNMLENRNLAALLADAVPTQRMRLMVRYLQEACATTIGLDHLPSIDAGLFDIGLDSLKTLELKAKLEEAVGLPLVATIALDQPTIRTLAEYLLAEMQSRRLLESS
jgi:acyl carrier protein